MVKIIVLSIAHDYFAAGTVQTLQMIAFPAVRAILSGLVDADDYG